MPVWLSSSQWVAKTNGVCNFWEVLYHSLFFFFADWNMNVLAGALAVISDHEVETEEKCGAMSLKKFGSHTLKLSISRVILYKRAINLYFI